MANLGGYETKLRAQGFDLIAGADEAGRGAWAGPMVAAAVVLPPDFDKTGIRDSKMLTPSQREEAFERIVASASPATADVVARIAEALAAPATEEDPP